MKVCHVTSAHPEEDGRIFRRACIASEQAGFDTYLVERGCTYKKSNVQIIGVGYPKKKGRLFRIIFFARKIYEAALRVDADLYQLHDPELLPYAIKLKENGKAVIFDAHEDYVEQIKSKPYLTKWIAYLLAKAYDKYSRYVFNRLDGLTYPGGDGHAKYDKICRRVVITDNYPWLNEFYEKYDDSTVKDDNSVCYIGRISKERGITQLIKASYNAQCTLYLAGPISTDYRAEIERMNEYSCVKYLGTLNREEILILLSKVTVGACTLLNIGQYYKMTNLPTKVYEYMSMGLPVILNDSEYNKKIIEKHSFGICVNPLDTIDMSEKIRLLLENHQLMREFGNNGRSLVKNEYCWDREKDKLLSMYIEILGE